MLELPVDLSGKQWICLPHIYFNRFGNNAAASRSRFRGHERSGQSVSNPPPWKETSVAERIRNVHAIAVPADSFARAVAFAMSQADDVDVNEVLYQPTRQEF
jgi:hypothetical protein